jgi:hypothetical protein
MVYQGPPGVKRGLRKIAVEKARPEAFDGDANYDPQAGHPVGVGLPTGHYAEMPPHVGGSTKPIDTPTPFKLGGK